MIVTLTGTNDFARQQALRQLVQVFVAEHGDMDVVRLDAEEVDDARLHASVASMTFLTARRLVVLHSPGRHKTWTEQLPQTLQSVADSTDVVIVEPKLDKRFSYYKALKKDTDFREFNDLDATGL